MKKLLPLLCLIPFVLQASDYEGLVNPSTGAGYTLTLPLTHEDGGLEADVSSYSGILAISSGTTYELNSLAELNTALGGISVVDAGTLTDTKYCTWDATGSEIDCNSEGGLKDVVNDTTPQLGGTLDMNSNNITGANGEYVAVDQIRAYDASGLKLTDDEGNGIFVEDGGNVGVGTDSPDKKLDVSGNVRVTRLGVGIPDDWYFGTHLFDVYAAQPTTNKVLFSVGDSGIGSDYPLVYFQTTPTGVGSFINERRDKRLSLGNQTNGEVLTVNVGNVGIDTITPPTLLSLGNVSYTFTASGLSFGDGDTGHYEIADDALATRIGGVNVATWSSLGLDTDLPITYKQQSSDPAAPASGKCVTWASDGTGKGDAGDFLIACNVGGTTTWGTLFDASSGTAW
jgi:hypothetical protein